MNLTDVKIEDVAQNLQFGETMSCRNDGSCETQSAVGREAPADSVEKRKEHLAWLYWNLDRNVRAGDLEAAKRWQLEINRIEKVKE